MDRNIIQKYVSYIGYKYVERIGFTDCNIITPLNWLVEIYLENSRTIIRYNIVEYIMNNGLNLELNIVGLKCNDYYVTPNYDMKNNIETKDFKELFQQMNEELKSIIN